MAFSIGYKIVNSISCYLDTLAAAQAGNHNLPAAITTEKKALSLIDPSDTNEVQGMLQRLNAYQAGSEPPPSYLGCADR